MLVGGRSLAPPGQSQWTPRRDKSQPQVLLPNPRLRKRFKPQTTVEGAGAGDAQFEPLPNSFRALSAGAAAFATALGLTEKSGSVPGRLCFHSGLLKKAQIPEPVYEAALPCPEWDAVAVGQPGAHAAAVTQQLAGMAAIAVNVHLDVWNRLLQHGREI